MFKGDGSNNDIDNIAAQTRTSHLKSVPMRPSSCLCVLMFAACFACAGSPTERRPEPQPSTPATAEVEATFEAKVRRVAGDAWEVAYTFDQARVALLFDSVGGRTEAWSSATKGAQLRDFGGLDALVFAQPRRDARFRIDARKTNARGTQPFIRFSDGSQAINVGLFPVLTVQDAQEAEAINGDLSRWRGEQPVVRVVVEAEGRLVAPDASVHRDSVTLPVRGGGGYVYAGDIEPLQTDAFTAIIDPNLPSWLAARFPADLKDVYAASARRWGFAPHRASVLLAFGGVEGALSNRGYAAGAQIAMSIQGAPYAEANPEARNDLLWFFAHEAAHQFQFHGELRREPGADWITEGAANAMAVTVLYDLGLVDRAWMERLYWKTHRDCVAELHDGPLRGKRGRAGYVCGDLIAQMTAAALPDGDYYGFWRAYQAEARAGDMKLTHARYFDLLVRRGASKAIAAQLDALLTTRAEDPARELAAVMTASGLAPSFAPGGGLSSMRFPVQATP